MRRQVEIDSVLQSIEVKEGFVVKYNVFKFMRTSIILLLERQCRNYSPVK